MILVNAISSNIQYTGKALFPQITLATNKFLPFQSVRSITNNRCPRCLSFLSFLLWYRFLFFSLNSCLIICLTSGNHNNFTLNCGNLRNLCKFLLLLSKVIGWGNRAANLTFPVKSENDGRIRVSGSSQLSIS
jgi:hypothetical protein